MRKSFAMGNLDFRTNPHTDNTTCYLIADARFCIKTAVPGRQSGETGMGTQYATLSENCGW